MPRVDAGRLGWGPMTPGKMETTRLEQLAPRIGAHYLFTHAGGCKHIVVFKEIRVHAAMDEQDAL